MLLVGARVLGVGPADVLVRDGVIEQVGPDLSVEGAQVVDVSGKCIGPGFIDSHVHLAYRPQAAEMREGGVVAAVDLGSPLSFLAAVPDELQVRGSGPMITAAQGYPTQSWGRDGYGLEVSDDPVSAVDRVVEAGATVIKIPFQGSTQLTDEQVSAVVSRAHAKGLKVVAHALTEPDAARAGRLGVDVLAHTPVEALSKETVGLWADKAVIGTLTAFGGRQSTLDNLKELREAGATVLYGTDFGNTRTAGIDPDEVRAMAASGMSAAEIRASATSVPAAFWGFSTLGSVEVGMSGLWIGDCSCAWCD